ncbi:hypothetical protein D6825_02305 [Candidatus Woesearchaeota archaeon]|nr:MAG: hypothetical protein D6825_02305 [Candidatus Woesearchaeota archaeon]
MPVVGLSFGKIVVEKHKPVKGAVKVNNNVSLKDVEKVDISVGSAKQEALKFHFEFTTKYEPGIGDMTMNGFLTFVEKPEKVKEILDQWKKENKVPKDVMSSVLNTVLSRCNVEAMILSREVNLPPPVPMPKVQVK